MCKRMHVSSKEKSDYLKYLKDENYFEEFFSLSFDAFSLNIIYCNTFLVSKQINKIIN